MARLDSILASTLVLQPPAELQRQVAELVASAPQAAAGEPSWRRAVRALPRLQLRLPRPNVVAAQGLAAVMVALASWQIFGWLSAFRPMVGDVAYALELLLASPAVAYVGGLQIDVQSLVLWSLVGGAGWLISNDNGIASRRLRSLTDRLRLP
ncbi:MAG: hypothetical protein M3336_00750 [Chloroflexota bacterium]|nr:hypothetical protein [Chloroflexota bacterium]